MIWLIGHHNMISVVMLFVILEGSSLKCIETKVCTFTHLFAMDCFFVMKLGSEMKLYKEYQEKCG